MAFPTVVLLDSFERVEKPLSNGSKWTVINGFKGTGECIAGGWVGTGGTEAGEDGAFWNVHTYVEPVVAVKIGGSLAAENAAMYLYACLTNPTTTAKSGYRLELIQGEVATNSQTITLERMEAGVFTTIGTFKMKASESNTVALKDSLALQVVKGKVVAWHKKLEAGAWAEVLSVADTTFTTGNVGMGSKALKEKTVYTFNKFEVGQTATEKLTAKIEPKGVTVRKINRLLTAILKSTMPSGIYNFIPNPSFAHDEPGGEATAWSATSSFLVNTGATSKVFIISKYASAFEIFGLESYCEINTAGIKADEGLHTGEVLSVKKGEPITVYFSLYEEVSEQKVRVALGSAACGFTESQITQGTSGWERHSITLTPTASGHIAFSVGTTGAPSAKSILIAAISTSQPYFDGDSFGAKWEGKSGNSISHLQEIDNLVADPSFEFDTIGAPPIPTNVYWTTFGTNTPESRNVVAGGVFGSQCIEIVTNSAHVNEGQGTKVQGALKLSIPYNSSIYLKGNAGGEKVQVFTEGITPGSKVQAVSREFTLTNTWQRYENTPLILKEEESEVPTNLYFGVRCIGTQTITWFMDGAMVTPNVEVAPKYFDGSSENAEWTGTPGQSISVKRLGILLSTTAHALTAKVASLGSLPRNINQGLTATLAFLGSLVPAVESIVKKFAASLSSSGSVSPNILHGLTATLPFQGTLNKVFSLVKAFSAKLELAGALPRNTTRTLTAKLSLTGSLSRAFELIKTLTANLPSLGTLSRKVAHTLTATLPSVGAISRNVIRRLKAIVSPNLIIANLVTNPSFEYGITGWIAEKNTVTQTTEQAFSGTHSLRGERTSATEGVLVFYKNTPGTLGKPETYWDGPVNEGVTYTFSIYSRAATIPRKAKCFIAWYNANRELISNTTGSEVINSTTEWTRYSVSGVAPAKAVAALLRFDVDGVPLNESHYLDALQFTQTTTAQTYVDGDTPGYEWNGAKGESTTYLVYEIQRKITHALEASVGLLGSLVQSTIHNLSAQLSFAGTLGLTITHPLAAILTFLGSLSLVFVRSLKATLAFAGTVQRQTTRQLTALLTFSTSLLDYIIYALRATLTFAGALPKRFELVKTLLATLNSSGTLQRYITFVQTATLRFAGSVGNLITRPLSATLNFAGSLPRQIIKGLTATLDFSSALGRKISHALIGTLTFVGSIISRVTFVLTGTLKFAGSVASRTTKRALTATLKSAGSLRALAIKNFVATLSFAGSQGRTITRALSARLPLSAFIKFGGEFVQRLTAALSFTGTLPRSILHPITATLSLVTILEKILVQLLTASLKFSGSLDRSVAYRLTATLTSAGALSRRITNVLAASLRFSGSLGRSFVHRFEAALGAAGALQRSILHQLAGALAISGKTSIKTYYLLTASVTFIGTVGISVLYRLGASLTSVGELAINSSFVQVLRATVGFTGQITRRSVVRVLRGALHLTGSLVEKGGGAKPIPDVLILKQEGPPSITLRRTEDGDVYGLVNHLEGYPEMEVESIVAKRKVFGRKG